MELSSEFVGQKFLPYFGKRLGISSWPAALIGIVVIKAVLSFAVRPSSFVVSYSGISYFLLVLLAVGFAVRNSIRNTLGSRPFWVFLATAYGLWAVDRGLGAYYELVRRIWLPASPIADSLLFLHIALLIASVATLPRASAAGRPLYRVILDSLFLVLFWAFLYGYSVFPYFLYSPAVYGRRFDLLYLVENLALVLAVGILALRVEAPWRSIYLHLLGASTLYALSSTVGNLSLDSAGYTNGRLFELGLTASACWFLWIPLYARQVRGAEAKAGRSDRGQHSQASAWAMLVVVVISIPIAWELVKRDESAGLRTLRLLIAAATIVCLATAAYIKELLARRELAFHVGLADDRFRLAMESGKSVAWDWDLKNGQHTWLGDLRTIFGISSATYVGSAEDFRRFVHPHDRRWVRKAVDDAMHSRQPYVAEFRVLWPDGTVRWVAARGKFYYSRHGAAERMLGTAADITDQKRMEEALRESEERFRLAAGAGRMYAFEWNVVTDALVRSAESLQIDGIDELMQISGKQMLAAIHPDDRPRVVEAIRQATPENPISKVSYRMRRADDSTIWVETTARAFFDEQGKVLRMVGMVADANDRKLAEEALSSMSRRVIEAEERERSRIATELHEDIGQRLALLAIEIERLKTDSADQTLEMRGRMEAVWKQTLDILTDVKASAHELHSPRLEYLGIEGVMRSFCREFNERKRVEISFASRGVPSRTSPELSVCLLRVLQEALYNGVKHSGTQRFDVRLWGTSEEIHLTVSDTGRGFDVETAMNRSGLGLLSMQQRLKLVNGSLFIGSEVNRGTTIHARVRLG
jgi:PAS domain S-box-containing protein